MLRRVWPVQLFMFMFLLVITACSSSSTNEASVPDQTPTESTAIPTEPTAAPVSETVDSAAAAGPDLENYGWRQVLADAPWGGRAGLRLVELNGRLLLMGGRTPNESTLPGDSRLWGDVWQSDDAGTSWSRIHTADDTDSWSPRAYFQAVVKDDAVFIIGGQDFGLQENPFCELLEQGFEPPPSLGIDPDAPCPEFLPTSQFFNDVWRSADGTDWQQMTEKAPWTGRAGLSAEVFGDHIYMLGGSTNDDSSIIGPDGPKRIYYNDVWRSTDGADWELVIDAAPWSPRAGAVTVVVDDRMYLLGGEDGFTCTPLPDCEPPYFNDVWVTVDGVTWNQVSDSAGWSPRPGHACELVDDTIVCFGGFGLISNPVDMWTSPDGADWSELASPPWSINDPTKIKYDFASAVVGPSGSQRVITAGGDRETFDFADPENYLRIDRDVWVFEPS